MWRFWLVEVPAFIVTLWYRVYVVVLAIGGLVTVSAVMVLLVLWFGFGIRWGW